LTINTIATIGVEDDIVEIWAIPFWFEKTEDAIRVLRTDQFTDMKFIILVSQAYVEKLTADGLRPKFLLMMEILAGDMVKENWKAPED